MIKIYKLFGFKVLVIETDEKATKELPKHSKGEILDYTPEQYNKDKEK